MLDGDHMAYETKSLLCSLVEVRRAPSARARGGMTRLQQRKWSATLLQKVEEVALFLLARVGESSTLLCVSILY